MSESDMMNSRKIAFETLEFAPRFAYGDLDAGPKDCIWLPKGTELTFISEDELVFYAIHPANGSEEGV